MKALNAVRKSLLTTQEARGGNLPALRWRLDGRGVRHLLMGRKKRWLIAVSTLLTYWATNSSAWRGYFSLCAIYIALAQANLYRFMVWLALLSGCCMSASSQSSLSELNVSINLWNSHYGYVALCTGVIEQGEISDNYNRQQILSEMTNPVNVWMLSGELTEPESLRLQRASDFPDLVQSEEYNTYMNRIRALAEEATLWFRVEWQLPNDMCIQTLVIANQERCLYNSILSESFYITQGFGLTCEHWEARNFFGWGWKVGEVIVSVNAVCDPITGCLVGCTHSCVAWVSIGTVERNNCNVQAVQDCCVLQYDIVVRGGLWTRIFGIPIGIGSTLSLNGTCMTCCGCRGRHPLPLPRPKRP